MLMLIDRMRITFIILVGAARRRGCVIVPAIRIVRLTLARLRIRGAAHAAGDSLEQSRTPPRLGVLRMALRRRLMVTRHAVREGLLRRAVGVLLGRLGIIVRIGCGPRRLAANLRRRLRGKCLALIVVSARVGGRQRRRSTTG